MDEGARGAGTEAECTRRTGKSFASGNKERRARGSLVESVREKEGAKEQWSRPNEEQRNEKARRAERKEEYTRGPTREGGKQRVETRLSRSKSEWKKKVAEGNKVGKSE